MFSVKVPTAAPDFHGDASASAPRGEFAKQVAVVLADRELLFAVNPGLLKTLLNFSFKGSDFAASSSSHAAQSFVAVGQSALCGVGGSGKSFALSSGSASHAGELLLAPIAQLSTGFQNDPLDGTWRDAESIRDAANTNALIEQGYDQADVCWIGWEPFSGHVYNFETETGTYCADSILTHNCRSTTVPVIDYDELGFTPPPTGTRASQSGQVPANESYGQWLAKQPLPVKAKALGANKVAYFDKLSAKYGPKDAIAKLVRDDGSELTLDQLRARYGKP
jgi:hypothetical protein